MAAFPVALLRLLCAKAPPMVQQHCDSPGHHGSRGRRRKVHREGPISQGPTGFRDPVVKQDCGSRLGSAVYTHDLERVSSPLRNGRGEHRWCIVVVWDFYFTLKKQEKDLTSFYYVCGCFAFTYVCVLHACCPGRSGEWIRSMGTGAAEGRGGAGLCWSLNSGPLQQP